MTEEERRAAVIRGMCEGLHRLYQNGIYTAKMTVDECDRLLGHEWGCPEDVRARLEQLRAAASRKLL